MIRKLSYYTEKRSLISIFLSLISMFSTYCYLFYKGDLTILFKNSLGPDIFWLVILIAYWKLCSTALKVIKKYNIVPILSLAIFFALTILIGHAFSINDSLNMYLTGGGFILFLLMLVGFTILFSFLLLMFYNYLDTHKFSEDKDGWHNKKPIIIF